MLKSYTKTINLSAASMVDIKGDIGTPVLIMSASFGKGGKINTGETVQNADLYDEYFDEIMKDSAEFKKMVREEYNKLYDVTESDKGGE